MSFSSLNQPFDIHMCLSLFNKLLSSGECCGPSASCSLHYVISYKIIFGMKKWKNDMIVLVHENHDKWPNVTPVQPFVVVLTTQIMSVLSLVPIYSPK